MNTKHPDIHFKSEVEQNNTFGHNDYFKHIKEIIFLVDMYLEHVSHLLQKYAIWLFTIGFSFKIFFGKV